MPENQYVPFATGDGANTLATAAYIAAGFLAQGFQPGVASSAAMNTALRQVTTVAAALGQFTADNQTADVLDDGIPTNFETKFTAALKGAFASSSVHFGVATGTDDAMVVAASPPMMPTTSGAYQAGSFLVLKTPPGVGNGSTAPTINSNAIGNIAIEKPDGSPLVAADYKGAAYIILFFDGTGCFLLSFAQSQLPGAAPQGGLVKTPAGLALGYDNLPVETVFNPADKIGLSATESEDGLAEGTPFAATLSGLGSFFSSLFETTSTFAQITATNSVGLSINGGDVAIPQGVNTVVPLQSISVNAAFGSVGNGVLTVMKAGYYIFIASGALFLGSSHAQDTANLRFSLNLSRNGTSYGGSPSGGIVPVPVGGGQAAVDLVLPQIQYLQAGDQISLLAYAANQYGDAQNVGVSGFTNMLVALLNS